MPLLQYTGSVSQTLMSNADFNGYFDQSLDFASVPINWQGQVIPQLAGKSLIQLITVPIYQLMYSANVRITGQQYFCGGSIPETTFTLTVRRGDKYTRTYQADTSRGIAGCGIDGDHAGQYNVNSTFNISSDPIQIHMQQYNTSGSKSYGATNYTFILTLNIMVAINCTGSNLNNDLCSQYCLANPGACVSDQISYCLSGPNPPITTNLPCQDFIANYIQNNGPIAQIDNAIGNYCQKKYKGFGDLFGSGNVLDMELCACHMPKEQYQNFEQELVKLYPGFGNIGLVDQCLLPQCASSRFKSLTTGVVCDLPQCLNIASFRNDGTFDNSTVIINQNSKCANIISGGGSNGGGSNSNGLWEKILLGTIIVIFIIIVIIAIILAVR